MSNATVMATLGLETSTDTAHGNGHWNGGVCNAVPRTVSWMTAGAAPTAPAAGGSVPAAGAAPAKFDLETDVSAIMTANGWAKGAMFQKRWFAGPAKVMDPALKLKDTKIAVETSLVTMKWVLSSPFSRARTVRDSLFSPKAWLTDNAKAEWKKRLDVLFALPANAKATRVAFGNLKATGRAAYDQHLTFAVMDKVTEPSGKPDDLLASLGRFTFFLIPEGTADRTPAGYSVTLANVGVMVGDYFDFDGFQPLGWWALPDKMEMPGNWEVGRARVRRGWVLNDRPGFTWVDNQSYRDFRTATRRGEDFIIFSDVEVTAVNETFVIP